MTTPLSKVNTAYWTKRSESYGKQHFAELTDLNASKWDSYLTKVFKKANGTLTKAVDIGTGPGFLAILLAKKGLEVDAVDMNPAMLKKARSKPTTDATTTQNQACFAPQNTKTNKFFLTPIFIVPKR